MRQLHRPANRRAPSSILLKWRGVFRSHPAKTVSTARSVASSKTCSNFCRTCSETPSMANPPDIKTDSYPTTTGYFNRKPSGSPIDVLWTLAVVAEAGLHPIPGAVRKNVLTIFHICGICKVILPVRGDRFEAHSGKKSSVLSHFLRRERHGSLCFLLLSGVAVRAGLPCVGPVDNRPRQDPLRAISRPVADRPPSLNACAIREDVSERRRS
jgi:hypothetical protein